jgi:hypothetical protein
MASLSDAFSIILASALHYLRLRRGWHLIKPIGKEPMMQRWNGSSWEYRGLTEKEIDKYRNDLV